MDLYITVYVCIYMYRKSERALKIDTTILMKYNITVYTKNGIFTNICVWKYIQLYMKKDIDLKI